MHRRNIKTWLMMAVSLSGIIGVASEEPPVVPNKSEITAEVLSIEREDFPQTLITFQILESKNVNGFHNLLESGDVMEASPQYVYEFVSGTRQIICTDPQNMQNFSAYYLLPKDRISAVASARGGNGNITWWVTDIKRIAEREPGSDIIAEVLNVERRDFPEVNIALKIIESGDAGDVSNLLETGMLITVSPHYIYEDDEFLCSEPRNVENLLAYYLLPGDIIKGKATAEGGDDDIIWIISDLVRINQR